MMGFLALTHRTVSVTVRGRDGLAARLREVDAARGTMKHTLGITERELAEMRCGRSALA
jgi:hypothetical protein